jgi:hypothetical protein
MLLPSARPGCEPIRNVPEKMKSQPLCVYWCA